MDKTTALKILALDDSATFEQAKKSYHAMAKIFHPDVEKIKKGLKKNSDKKMKEINLAFCYLAPVLKSTEKIKKPEKNHKQQNKKQEMESCSKDENSFFHNIFNSLAKTFAKKRQDETFTKNIKKDKSPKNSDLRKNNFSDILKNADPGTHINKISSDKTVKKADYKKRTHKTYHEYMILKNKMHATQSNTNQTMGVGKIEKIHPVRPVNPVGRN